MPPKTATKPPFQLTPEQLALQAARRALREKKAALPAPSKPEENNILKRDWLELPRPETNGGQERLSIMTWNSLAQSLVRRDLFPGSDALRYTERGPMLSSEILAYNADILCLQEVDRLGTLIPAIESQYSHIYACGRSKAHGCMVLFKKGLFELRSSTTVYYDEEDIREGTLDDVERPDIWRRGTSRVTKNIALVAALKRKESEGGFIIATTHLFWHPAYVYERSKQVGLLLRSISTFRRQNNLRHWPCFIAGDFNMTPDDVAYSLMVGESITPSQQKAFNYSRVVHVSVDPTIGQTHQPKQLHEESEKDDEENEGNQTADNDPDRVIINSRPSVLADGLLDFEELKALYQESHITPLRSLYDEFLTASSDKSVETIRTRLSVLEGRGGANEPMYTSYTHFWKSTLDYVFLLAPESCNVEVEGILRPHRAEDMGTGLPKRGICGSDHISLAAKVVFSRRDDVE